MELPIQPLNEEAFGPFGRIIRQPERAAEASGPGWHWWSEIATMGGGGRPCAIGYLDLQPADHRFDWAERHMESPEALIPLGGDCLVYVAPPEHPAEPDRLPDLNRFQVFRVPQGQGVLLHPAVWHGAPFALDRPINVVVLLLQGTGATDVHLVRFEERPVRIVGA